MFVTYDLDAHNDVQAALNRVGLKENAHYAPLGINQAGKDCIEALLPQSVLSAVNGRETDLVMKLGSTDNSERKSAKQNLKKEYLKEFKSRNSYTRDELKDLSKVVRQVNARLNGGGTGPPAAFSRAISP